MKFRTLAIGIIIGVFSLSFPGTHALAAETQGTTGNQEQASTTGDSAAGTNIGLDNASTGSDITEVKEDAAEADRATTEDTTVVQDNAITEDGTATENGTATEEGTAIEDEEGTAAEEEIIKDSTGSEAEESEEASEEEEEKASEKDSQKANYTKAELRLLSALIYCEAGGESYNGKLAVGIVVMNRKNSSSFPDTIKGVIYQKYQFSPARNGSLKKALAEYDNGKFTSADEKECIKAAKAALNGTTTITVGGKKKDMSKFLYFSGRLKGYTYKLGNHQFK